MKRKEKTVKKLAMALGGVLVLLLVLMISIPFFVDVDKYRPKIVEAANQQINGSLDLGKLSLSLWGQIRIDVASMTLKDAGGKEVVSVKNSYFHIPFSSLFSGAPSLTLFLKQPTVNVVKNRAGKINLLSLVKETSTAAAPDAGKATPSVEAGQSKPGSRDTSSGAPGTTTSTAAAPKSTASNTGTTTAAPRTLSSGTPSAPSGSSSALPAMATNAHLGIELDDAYLNYTDATTGLKTEVKDLNLRIKDLSLSRPTELELWANLDTRLGKTFALKGPARLTATGQPDFKNSVFDHATIKVKLDMNSVEMTVPETFSKKAGIPTEASMTLVATDKNAKIESLALQFHNVKINGSGSTSFGDAEPRFDVSLKSNEIEIAPWVELVPMLKEFELGGKAKVEVAAGGTAAKPNYKGSLTFASFSAKAPMLKSQPKFDGIIHFITDQLDQIDVTMRAPGNEARLTGKLVSFAKPNVSLSLSSKGMDIDQLVDFSKTSGKAKTASVLEKIDLGISVAYAEPAAKAADYDAMLEPLRANAMMGDIALVFNADIKQLKAYEVKMSNLACRMTLRDLNFGMDPCSVNVFGGSVKTGFQMAMKPKAPSYQFNLQVNGLEILQAMESQLALFKNTLTGKAQFSMTGQGASLNPTPALNNLKAQGNMKVEQANFATIDIMKMVGESLNKSIEKIAEKVPAARGKTISGLPSHSSKYDSISSSFTISGGKFTAPDFVAKATPNQGIDLKGKTTVGMVDFSLDTDWEVIDTYNLSKARDISVEQAGIKVDHILAEGDSPVRFPVHAGCSIKEPCYSYTQVPEFLGKIALNNVTHAIGQKAKAEAQNRAQELLKQAAPALGDKLKGLFR